MIKKLGGRKAVLGVLILIVGVALELLTEKGLTPNMIYFLFGIGGAYFTANTASKVVKKDKVEEVGLKDDVTAIKHAISPIAMDIEELKDFVNETKDSGKGNIDTLDTSLKAVANQNAVIMQSLNNIAGGMNHLLDGLSASGVSNERPNR